MVLWTYLLLYGSPLVISLPKYLIRRRFLNQSKLRNLRILSLSLKDYRIFITKKSLHILIPFNVRKNHSWVKSLFRWSHSFLSIKCRSTKKPNCLSTFPRCTKTPFKFNSSKGYKTRFGHLLTFQLFTMTLYISSSPDRAWI